MKSTERKEKIKVGIIGATGMVGQRFVTLLSGHPWFEITSLMASGRSAGRLYGDAVDGRWKLSAPCPDKVLGMPVTDASDVSVAADACDMVFCAVNMPKSDILALEEKYARAELPVVSNNSANRWTPDVPMVVPEINPAHLGVIEHQHVRTALPRGELFAQRARAQIGAPRPAQSVAQEFFEFELMAAQLLLDRVPLAGLGRVVALVEKYDVELGHLAVGGGDPDLGGGTIEDRPVHERREHLFRTGFFHAAPEPEPLGDRLR